MLREGVQWAALVLWMWLAWQWGRSLLGPGGRADLKSWRAFLLFTLTASMAGLLLTLLLRHLSPYSCPADLRSFGSHADYFTLFDPRPADPGPGRCLPSAHASLGFMWIAAVYASRRWKPEWLTPIALTVTTAAAMIGLGEIVRGAHFLSQVLLTAALCWFFTWSYSHWWPHKGPARVETDHRPTLPEHDM